MQILRLELRNFRAYDRQSFDLQSGFNLIIGPNASGKTTLLKAMSVALESWVAVMNPRMKRTLPDEIAHLRAFREGVGYHAEPQYPVIVEAFGHISEEDITWRYERTEREFGPSSRYDSELVRHARRLRDLASSGRDVTLPVIAYYGVDRSLSSEKNAGRWESTKGISNGNVFSRLQAYRGCLDSRVTSASLAQFLLREALFDASEKVWPEGRAVKDAMIRSIPGTQDIRFAPDRFELMVDIAGQGPLPFASLSDGQRSLLAMIGDLAQRMARLNPHLTDRVLLETPGIVLIDELDLHLHPTWQRDVVRNLKEVFPKIQFVATTHSPQIIGQVPAREVTMLTKKGPRSPAATFGMESNDVLETVQGTPVADPEVHRLQELIQKFLVELEIDKAEKAFARLRELAEQPNPRTIELETALGDTRSLLSDAEESDALDDVDLEVKDPTERE